VGEKPEVAQAARIAAGSAEAECVARRAHDLARLVDSSLLRNELLDDYLRHRFLPLSHYAGIFCVATSASDPALPASCSQNPETRCVRVSQSDLLGALEHVFRDRLRDRATLSLEHHEPHFSARKVITRKQFAAFAALAVALLSMAFAVPNAGGVVLAGIIAAGYVANAIFRGWLFWVGSDDKPASVNASLPRNGPNELPVYTILVPLYREANIVQQITDALRALDYPADKLDVKLIVEADDVETVAAVHAASINSAFEVLHVPEGQPRTKPRACNYALQFARGEFLVIYDAEDQPEADQLKKAVAAFRSGPADVACLQARLNFFNAKECWISTVCWRMGTKPSKTLDSSRFSLCGAGGAP